MIEAAALSALLFDIGRERPKQQAPLRRIFAHTGLSFLYSPLVYCRSPSSIESTFFEKFANDRFKLSEAMKQVRSVSPSRIEWESKPGANIFKMTICALIELVKDGPEELSCKLVSPTSARFKKGDIHLDVALTRDGAIFTAFSNTNSDSAKLEKSATESIGADIMSNVRSYSYSWSSGSQDERVFDPHNPFGEMESMIHHFFGNTSPFGEYRGGNGDTFEMPPLPDRTGRQGNRANIASTSMAGRAGTELENMGVQVIIPKESNTASKVDWSSLAGYEKVKSQVEESVILGLKHPSIFQKIIDKTRGKPSAASTNKPKVVLFEGPPGTGKSSTARIIAHETNVPMIHIPLESVVSKWFGESEKQMAKIYELAREVARAYGASSVILFIDEIDSLVSSRDIGTPHEASKRILSVMLRQIDGFNSEADAPQCTLICATNRKKDLDKAFLSRVDSSIHFGLPSEDCRAKILKLYAKHLSDNELLQLASITDGLSGRNLKDLCQAAERHWTATVVRGLSGNVRDEDVDISPPPVSEYIEAAKEKFTQQIS